MEPIRSFPIIAINSEIHFSIFYRVQNIRAGLAFCICIHVKCFVLGARSYLNYLRSIFQYAFRRSRSQYINIHQHLEKIQDSYR